MTTRAQLLVVIGLACVLVFILLLVRRRQLQGKYAVLWMIVGLALVPLALFPDLVTWIAHQAGIFYEPTVIILAAIAFLMLLTVHFSFELSRLQDRTRSLAEQVALLKAELATREVGVDAVAGDESDDAVE
ncbi:MAG: hypothetical protein JJLCMIEE_01324 [Acidimicrobiales bacterium]|nr:MAG: DUF2304 domain-containing protein [Actinomycetota bacterium]MBV6508264.1 hypothetical protein [Acidimicrobiales bacterium]RIK07335.1 MAG: DUF2304 domain-containing protein [Acidobacteriota bacterium]